MMRVAVIGGTGFIGRATVADLESAGHQVLVIHRGHQEPEPSAGADPPAVPEHAHVERHDVAGLVSSFDQFGAEALVDGIALTAHDADDVLTAVPGALRMVVLSSVDVYRAFGSLHADAETDPIPIDESSPVRASRYLYRGKVPGIDEYEKLEVEERFLWRGATVIRLPLVYGEHDPQRREEPLLRRIRAGRTRVPIGPGTWLCTRGYVGEMARGIRLALESDAARGEIFNLGERQTWSTRAWLEQIAAATDAAVELVPVAEVALPRDLGVTGSIRQHIVVDSTKAARLLGWVHADPAETVRASVRWHLAHPPANEAADFSTDDQALASAGVSET